LKKMATREEKENANKLMKCFMRTDDQALEAYEILKNSILGTGLSGLSGAMYHGLRKSHIFESQSSPFDKLRDAYLGAASISFQGVPAPFRIGAPNSFVWIYRTQTLEEYSRLPPTNPDYLEPAYKYVIKSSRALIQACLNTPGLAVRFDEDVHYAIKRLEFKYL